VPRQPRRHFFGKDKRIHVKREAFFKDTAQFTEFPGIRQIDPIQRQMAIVHETIPFSEFEKDRLPESLHLAE
jgi:hypothetical protein